MIRRFDRSGYHAIVRGEKGEGGINPVNSGNRLQI